MFLEILFGFWIYGAFSSLLGIIFKKGSLEEVRERVHNFRKDDGIPEFLAIQVIVFASLFWPILFVRALARSIWLKWRNRNKKIYSKEEQEDIIKQAEISRENYMADQTIEKARKEGRKVVQLIKSDSSPIHLDQLNPEKEYKIIRRDTPTAQEAIKNSLNTGLKNPEKEGGNTK